MTQPCYVYFNSQLLFGLAALIALGACSGREQRSPSSTNTASTGGSANGTGGNESGLGGSTASTEPSVPKVCEAGAAVLSTGAEFIADFESQALDGWFDYRDDTTTATFESIAAAASGAVGTNVSGRLNGSGFEGWGAGMGIGLSCMDVSAFDGISFWAKGTSGTDNQLTFQVVTRATHSAEFGGDCTAQCFDHLSATVTLNLDWTQHTVAWSELEQAGWGTPAAFDFVILGLNWATPGPDFDYSVDEIALYEGVAATGPVAPPEGEDDESDAEGP